MKEAQFVLANFSGATLACCDFTDANLVEANLIGCDVTDAVFTGADLQGCQFGDTDLRTADLSAIKDDVRSVLWEAQDEIPGLIQAMQEGRIDGSVYQGECACLMGTIANLRGVPSHALEAPEPDANRPAERWFLAIRKGDTPENHHIAEITMEWIEEFLDG